MSRITRKRQLNRRDFLSTAGSAALGAAVMGNPAARYAESGKRFRVIDVHFHTFNSKLQGSNGIPNYYPDATIEYELRLMDRGGVDKAFLITYNAEDVGPEIRSRGESPVVLLPVANHEYQVQAWQAHKERFWWFTDGVNPLHEHFLESLEHDFELGASGVKLLPLFHGLLPDNPAWLPVYELCEKHGKPIINDFSWWLLSTDEMGFGWNESSERKKLAKSFKSYAEFAELIDPIFSKFPKLAISLAHCGTPKSRDDYEHIFALIARHPNLHCDLAAIPDFNPWFIEQLVKAVGPRKVMYGTDVPYWLTGQDSYRLGTRRWGVIADGCFFLSDEEKQLILAGNAERFVKNELP